MRPDTAAAVPPPTRRVGRFEWERALDHADLPPRTVAVALAFATFANGDGTSCRPGEVKLSQRSHLPQSTVRKHLGVLRAAGWARRIGLGSSGGTNTSADEYHLTVPVTVPAAAMDEHDQPDSDERVDDDAEVRDNHRSPASADHRSSMSTTPRPTRRTTASERAVPTPTTAHQLAQASTDHRSPVGRPPLTSEQTTAHQLAPTNHYQASTKGGPPPRCLRHADIPSNVWVAEPCRDCALLRRAHAADQTDRARILARVRRACTECDELGWLLGPDRVPLMDPAVRCSHPTVAPEVWSGEDATAPPLPPPVEASPGGRHRRPDPADHGPPPSPEQRRPRPSPYPRSPEGALTR